MLWRTHHRGLTREVFRHDVFGFGSSARGTEKFFGKPAVSFPGTSGGATMVLAYLAASLAKQGGRPPSPRTAMAMMAALLAAQITWTVTKHRARLGDPSSIAPTSASIVDDGGFSLALGVRRVNGRGIEGAAGLRERRPGRPAKTSGDGFESWWLGELDEPSGGKGRGERR